MPERVPNGSEPREWRVRIEELERRAEALESAARSAGWFDFGWLEARSVPSPETHEKSLAQRLADFVRAQKPLPDDVARVLYDNLSDLYEADPPEQPAPVSQPTRAASESPTESSAEALVQEFQDASLALDKALRGGVDDLRVLTARTNAARAALLAALARSPRATEAP